MDVDASLAEGYSAATFFGPSPGISSSCGKPSGIPCRNSSVEIAIVPVSRNSSILAAVPLPIPGTSRRHARLVQHANVVGEVLDRPARPAGMN